MGLVGVNIFIRIDFSSLIARNLLFHLRRRIHWRAGLGRGKGGSGGKGEIFGKS
jgi:hypothetical protein